MALGHTQTGDIPDMYRATDTQTGTPLSSNHYGLTITSNIYLHFLSVLRHGWQQERHPTCKKLGVGIL